MVRPEVVDAQLIAIDHRLFGVDLAYWMGGFASPLLTHVMVQCYFSYFLAPGLLGCLFYWRHKEALFADTSSLCAWSLCSATPAASSCPQSAPTSTNPVISHAAPGRRATHFLLSEVDKLKGVARDCFPSMSHRAHHRRAGVAARYRRWLALAYLPIAIGLYLSTLYLRMHYGIDVLAGFAVSALAVVLGPRLERWWKPNATAAAASGIERAKA